MSELRTDELLVRVRRLERSAGRYRLVSVGTALLLLTFFLGGMVESDVKDVIEARRVEVLGDDGAKKVIIDSRGIESCSVSARLIECERAVLDELLVRSKSGESVDLSRIEVENAGSAGNLPDWAAIRIGRSSSGIGVIDVMDETRLQARTSISAGLLLVLSEEGVWAARVVSAGGVGMISVRDRDGKRTDITGSSEH